MMGVLMLWQCMIFLLHVPLATGTAASLSSQLQVTYGDRGPAKFAYGVYEWDLDFTTSGSGSVEVLDGDTVTSYSTATATFLGKHDDGAGKVSFMYVGNKDSNLNVTFVSRQGWQFVTKEVSLVVPHSSKDSSSAGAAVVQHIGAVTLSNATAIRCVGSSWNHTYSGNAVVKVARCNNNNRVSEAAAAAQTSSLFAAVSSAFNSPQLTLGGGPDRSAAGANTLPAASLTINVQFGNSKSRVGSGLQVYGGETFTTDKLLLGVQTLSKTWIQPRGLGSVNTKATVPNMLNAAERDAMVACVEEFLVSTPARKTSSVKVNVAWDEDDYQIDLADPTQSNEYKRIIDRNAQLGISHMVFAPTNTDLALGDLFVNTDTLLDVGWEYVLWAGFGLGIRNGTYSNANGIDAAAIKRAIPQSLQTILDYAKLRGVKLMAYVYPVIVGFVGGGSPPWLYPTSNPHVKGHQIYHSDLGNRQYQDWLANALSQFYDVLGLGGYSFDGVFMGDANSHNSTTYGQWTGWMSVLATLRARHPEMVIDNRLSAHAYGPWQTISGSYSEPIAGDENPETYGIPVPTLRTDHVAADNLRRVNYWYRQENLLPMSRIPGFFSHQTERSAPPAATAVDVCSNSSSPTGRQGCYRRDFDLLGYRYSMVAQVATAGLNNVMCMLPARDEAEFNLFPADDVAFIQSWLNFTDRQLAALSNTVPLAGMDVVTMGRIDGTAAFERPLSCTAAMLGGKAEAQVDADAAIPFENVLGGDAQPAGFIFLFNPGYKQASANVTLDNALSPQSECSSTTAERMPAEGASFVVSEIYPEQKVVGRYLYGESLPVVMDGSSAKAFSVTAAADVTMPYVVGAAVSLVEINGSVATLHGVQAEAGQLLEGMTLVVPQLRSPSSRAPSRTTKPLRSATPLATVVVNGHVGTLTPSALLPAATAGAGDGSTVGELVYTLPPLEFGNVQSNPFPHAKEVALAKSSSSGGNTSFTGAVNVPSAIFAQLSARAKAYPVPWTKQDNDASWLRPERLLLFLQLNCSASAAGACDDTMAASLSVGGTPIVNLMAYETRCTECTNVNHPSQPRKSSRFNGFYWDVSRILKPDSEILLALTVETKFVPAMQGLFFENTLPVVQEGRLFQWDKTKEP